MHADHNIPAFVSSLDTAVAMALFAGIGSFALSSVVSAAQASVYEQMRAERDPDNAISTDDRNDKDEAQLDREPPYGLENRESPVERAKRYGALYAGAYNACVALGAGEYDRPQTVASHVNWRATQYKRDADQARRTTDVNEAIRLAGRAKSQRDFWRDRLHDVLDIAQDATDVTDDQAEAALFELRGVDAVQALVKGYGRLVGAIAQRKGSPYFTSRGEIGDTLRSDVGAMEASLEKVKEFIGSLEKLYAREVLDAVNAGRRLDTVDTIEASTTLRNQQRLATMLSDLG